MADGRHVGKYSKCHNSPTNGPTVTKLWVFTSHHVPDMSPMMRLPWQRPLPTNGALNILLLWASVAERVNQSSWNLVYNSKFGQQWQSCDQLLKIGGRSLLESIRNAITRQQMDRLGRYFGGRIPSCSQYWKYYNSSYDGTDWDDSWLVASKQHLCCRTVSSVFGRYC